MGSQCAQNPFVVRDHPLWTSIAVWVGLLQRFSDSIAGAGKGNEWINGVIFTARCYAQRGDAIVCLYVCTSVRPSVCDVEVYFSHRLEYFENNFTAEQLKVPAHIDWLIPTRAICSNGNPKIRVEWVWDQEEHKNADYNISETVQDVTKVNSSVTWIIGLYIFSAKESDVSAIQGHPRSLILVCDFLLERRSNLGPILTVSEILRVFFVILTPCARIPH